MPAPDPPPPEPPKTPDRHAAQAPRHPWQPLSLKQLQRLRHWRVVQRERRQHRLECAVWDAVLTVWMLGWTAWLPAVALDLQTLLPLCVFGVLGPQLYVYARARAHLSGRLRCDWLQVLHGP